MAIRAGWKWLLSWISMFILISLSQQQVIQTGLSNTQVVDGDTVIMQVTLTRNNVGQGIWSQNGTMLSSGERIGITATGRVQTLTVRNASISDGGLYKFEVDGSSTEATLTVTVFRIGLKDVSVDIGAFAYLQVVLGRQTSETGMWYKNNVLIQSIPGKQMIQSIGTSRQLVIFSPQSDDAGTYTLAIRGQSTSAKLSVGVTILRGLNSLTVQIGRNVTLEVTLSEPNITEGYWSRNNLRLPPSTNRLITVIGDKQRLTIMNFQTLDEGRYTYRINGQTTEATLTISEVPALRITSPLQSMTVTVEKTEILQVSLSQENVDQGKWVKDGIDLTDTNNRYATVDGFDHRLVFLSTTVADTGRYTYIVGAELSSTAQFIVLDIRITSELEPVVIALGGTAVLQTTLSHSNIRMGIWFKGDVELTTDNDNMKIATNERLQSLTIINVQQDDIGSYRYKIGTRETAAVISVDGVWREWSQWVTNGQCSVTCGGGNQPYIRSRVCIQPQAGGQPCPGSANEATTRVCSTNNCPIDGVWREWSQWVPSGQCNVTCGGGSQPYIRSRVCNQPQFGGRPCQGGAIDATTRVCNTNACPNSPIQVGLQDRSVSMGDSVTFTVTLLSADITSGIWLKDNVLLSNTTRIQISVVGTQQSLRISNVQLSDAGSYRYVFSGAATTATLTVDAVDGVWREWSQWVTNGQCSVTCGGGNQPYIRSRVCIQPQAGGQPCQGSTVDATTRVCNTNTCPTDGVWTAWSQWVPTRQCNVTCGGGYQPITRSRVCIQPQFGGQPCQGSATAATTRACNTNDCPIDGVWTAWAPWSSTEPCNVTCGGGFEQFRRVRICIEPQFNGQPCQGTSTEVINRVCNSDRCPNSPIQVGLQDKSVSIGDSVTFTVTLLSADITSGIWLKDNVRLSNTTRIQISVVGTQQSLRISNVQLSDAGNYRYVFSGAATTATLTVDAVNGVWREWSQWLPNGQCTVTCGGGSQPYTRSRVCIQPQFGGQPCLGSANETTTRVCSTNNCPFDGVWREWSPWVATRQCNVTCGGGYQQYTRSRVCIQPQFGGRPCQGSTVDATTRVCNTNACPDSPIQVGLQDRSVSTGDSVTFTVTLLSADITSGIWLKDNVRLSNTTRIQISVVGTQQRLRISNVQLSDAGSYRYVFSGGATTATLTFNPGRDMCEDATRVNNIGYRYHPTDCDKYIQCYYNPNGNVLGVYRSCSFGYYWNQVTRRCDEPWRVTCPQEKCISPCSPSHKMEGSCRSYWKCEDSYSEGRCCPVGQRFIPGKGCQDDLNCEDECPFPHISRDPCDKLPDWDTDQATYIMAMGTIVENRSCESGNTFDILECGCKQQHNGICGFNYSSTFSSQNFPSWMTVTSTGFSSNEAIFNATSKMVLDIEMMTTDCPVVFTLKYREASSSPGRRVLASSSDCRRNNSLILYADEEGIHFHIKSWFGQVTKMMISTAGMPRSSWKTVTVTHNSRHLIGMVKSDTGRRTYISRIHAPDASIVECGLRIGSDGSEETMTAFLGSVDMFSVHQCDIGDLY